MHTPRQRLMQALITSDEYTRDARADRIQWLSEVRGSYPPWVGRTELALLLDNADQCLISGHFIAALVLALAAVEHLLVEELVQRELHDAEKRSPTFEAILQRAHEQGILSDDLFEIANLLRERRNPYCHFKGPKHEHNLGVRVFEEQRHPNSITEGDAKSAIRLMHHVFRSTLRERDG